MEKTVYIKPTKEEFNLMIVEVAERLKDMIYSEAWVRTEKMLRNWQLDKKINVLADDSYSINFEVAMVTGDFVQIIGRHRRAKK